MISNRLFLAKRNATKSHKSPEQLERALLIETVSETALNDLSAAFFIGNAPANRGNLAYVQSSVVTPIVCKASTTPSKMSATPIAETKKPTIRVDTSIPIAPNRPASLLA